MLFCQNLIKTSSGVHRSFSLSASRLLDVPSSKPLSEERQTKLKESQETLKWRQKPGDKPGAWYTNFKLFMEDDNPEVKETLVTRFQQPIDLRPSALKKWWNFQSEKKERFMQQFIPDRHKILGNDLAAAHFLVFRNAKVKFVGESEWRQMDENDDYDLPSNYVDGMFVEAIDCEGVDIYYEGLENIQRLKSLRFLSFKNVKSFDDWCVDRVSGSEFERLEVLNLSGTQISERGLQALYRVPSLRKLIVDEKPHIEWKLTLAMLQDINPGLQVVEIKPVEDTKKA